MQLPVVWLGWHAVCAGGADMPVDIQRAQVRQLQAAGAQVVEVLPRAEYDQEHLPGAISLPLGDLTRATAEHTLVRDRPIVVYCQDVE